MAEEIRYFHSLASPWACLGGRPPAEIATRHNVPIICRPVTVPTGTGGILLRTRPEPRQRHHALDLDRWRRHLGTPLTLAARHCPTDPKPAGLVVIADREGFPGTALLAAAATPEVEPEWQGNRRTAI